MEVQLKMDSLTQTGTDSILLSQPVITPMITFIQAMFWMEIFMAFPIVQDENLLHHGMGHYRNDLQSADVASIKIFKLNTINKAIFT